MKTSAIEVQGNPSKYILGKAESSVTRPCPELFHL